MPRPHSNWVPSATKADIEAKEAEIKTAKYTEIETLMTKDTAAKPDAAVLWAQLGLAQAGLKKYDDAETSFKKALEVDADSKKPNPAGRGHGELLDWARSMRAQGRCPRRMQPMKPPPRPIRRRPEFT